jgi:ferredoxin--NADP+ reductase
MPHVVTQPCCNDGSCVFACPVNAIQPTPDSPDFGLAEMLYIDPKTCVDCGACVSACPVGAIKPKIALNARERRFIDVNADWHEARRAQPGSSPRPLLAPVPPPLEVVSGARPLRVAIVGSGPAAMYAADEVLNVSGARVSMYERLNEPYGLVRFGVAPDHFETRKVAERFDMTRRSRRFSLHLGVEVGRDVLHEQLLESHDAVIYAVGAANDRRLDIPGIDLPGVASATEFVAWYNGHPDFAEREFDLSGRRVVVIGNGNVALDVSRIMALDPLVLARTPIAPRALAALRASGVEEVVVVGRRGDDEAAYTQAEFLGLQDTPSLRASVNLRYGLTPVQVLGDQRATGVEFVGEGGVERIDAGLVLTSIGYRGRPVAGLPFDEETGTVPNVRGRVGDRVYVAGWIKRGPRGFIGTNRSCSAETVRSLIEDFNARQTGREPHDDRSVPALTAS